MNNKLVCIDGFQSTSENSKERGGSVVLLKQLKSFQMFNTISPRKVIKNIKEIYRDQTIDILFFLFKRNFKYIFNK